MKNLVKLLLIVSCVTAFSNSAFATPTYTRTPNTPTIVFNGSINYSGHAESTVVDSGSYKIVTFGDTVSEDSPCVSNGTPLDEWDYDYDINGTVPGTINHVNIYFYYGANYTCAGGEDEEVSLETGSPAFTILEDGPPPIAGYDDIKTFFDTEFTENTGVDIEDISNYQINTIRIFPFFLLSIIFFLKDYLISLLFVGTVIFFTFKTIQFFRT